MTGFQVDLVKLGEFAGLVDRFSDDAHGAIRYIDKYQAWHESGRGIKWYEDRGIFAVLLSDHDEHVNRANERTTWLWKLAGQSRSGVYDTILYYKECDGENASRLNQLSNSGRDDARYASAKKPDYDNPRFENQQTPGSFDFTKDSNHPEARLKNAPDGAELKPQSDDITNFCNWLSDRVNVAWWYREAMAKYKWLAPWYGIFLPSEEPIEDIVTFLSGDWEYWADLAQGWKQCEEAVTDMAGNLEEAADRLVDIWTGNASDQAVAYFGGVGLATETEAGYFEYLHQVYKASMYVVWWAHNELNDIANDLLSALITFGVSGIAKAVASLPRIAKKIAEIPAVIKKCISIIKKIHDGVDKSAKGTRWADAGSGLATALATLATANEPDCKVERLLYQCGQHESGAEQGYRHPSGYKKVVK